MNEDSNRRRSRVVRYLIHGVAVVAVGCFLCCVETRQDDDEQPVPTTKYHPNMRETSFEPLDFEEGNAELQRLADRFGVKHYSWHYEEWFIRDFFDDMRGGFFVDVGAAHYSAANNTFFLEDVLEWSGIAIDAQQKHRRGYLVNRPRTKFFSYFVSDRSSASEDLHVPSSHPGMASSDKGSLDEMGIEIGETIQVPTITLDDLLDREGLERIDLLSMDIELAEPEALRGFDIKRFAPKLVCIEEFSHNRDVLEAYFEQNGYARIELWSRIDEYNSYYAPAELVENRTSASGAGR